jgi:hypothetical protein
MPYTNVEKGAKSFLKMFGTTEFYKKKWLKKIILDFFCCHLIQNQITLTRTSVLT